MFSVKSPGCLGARELTRTGPIPDVDRGQLVLKTMILRVIFTRLKCCFKRESFPMQLSSFFQDVEVISSQNPVGWDGLGSS